MRTLLLAVVSLAFVCGCGRDGLDPVPGPAHQDPVVAPSTTVHDESDGGCGGPPQVNDPSCPLDWVAARSLCSQAQPCTTLEKSCGYPNSGDRKADGTWSTALLVCTDIHAALLGLDAGTGVWTCAQ
jgi:hypothetical protein